MKNEKIRKIANNCIYTLLLLLAATALAFLIFFASSRNSANIALIYILALLLISQHTASYGYGIFSALFSVVCINCFFTYPYFAVNFTLNGYPITFIFMLTIALLASAAIIRLKKQEQMIAERERQINEAEKERIRANLLRAVSHDLRTPLTSIRGWVETIAQIRDPEDENYRKGIAIIGRETDRLYDMVEELLDFSRMQNGIKMELTPLDLVAELTDAALFVEARIKQEGLRLVYEEPDLPLPILGDAGRLRQVFINVLDNAIKYSSPGGAITLDLLDDGENAYVIIRDEGRGIAPDDLENVKLKFFKGKGAVRGSGIGLAVVDEIITAMDGAVDITSELGKGTAVKIRLPLYIPGRARPDP